jgi:hypothetical protein
VDEFTLIWRFSSNLTGDGLCPQLTVNDGASGWVSPIVIDWGGADYTIIQAEYTGVTLDLSSVWQLLDQIDGVTFDDGPLGIPQSGTVVP